MGHHSFAGFASNSCLWHADSMFRDFARGRLLQCSKIGLMKQVNRNVRNPCHRAIGLKTGYAEAAGDCCPRFPDGHAMIVVLSVMMEDAPNSWIMALLARNSDGN